METSRIFLHTLLMLVFVLFLFKCFFLIIMLVIYAHSRKSDDTNKKGRKHSPVISFPHRQHHYLHFRTHYFTFCVCVHAHTLIYLFFKLRLYEVFRFWKNKFFSLK